MTLEIYKRIAPFITVYSKDGRIGPLSAPDEVLAAIPNITRNDIERLRSSKGTRKETESGDWDLSRHVGSYLVDEPGPAYVVSVGGAGATTSSRPERSTSWRPASTRMHPTG